MAFCAECGKIIPKNAKFCPGCGAKVITELVEELGELFDDKTDTNEDIGELSKLFDDKNNINKKTVTKKIKIPKTGTSSISTNDNKYLKEFFTLPDTSEPSNGPPVLGPDDAKGFFGLSAFCFLVIISIIPLQSSDYYGDECEQWFEEDEDVECGLVWMIGDAWSDLWWLISFTSIFGILMLYGGIMSLLGDPEKAREWKEREEKRKTGNDKLAWKRMSPEPLFKRLEEAQKLVAKSSYKNLGIGESDTTRPPAYCYGTHLEIIGDVFGTRTDQTGIGKDADYYKLCEKEGMEGLYTREYDMMVVQFTKNQIMVYKCIFDVLEMTKRLEESYEWNYKHVVGINITGDDKEKNLGAGLAVTGTKYLVISAASGDKIKIILGAGTRQMDNGKQNMTTLGGEERIYKIANIAMKNIREAVREGAN